jgi:hypothetical protein
MFLFQAFLLWVLYGQRIKYFFPFKHIEVNLLEISWPPLTVVTPLFIDNVKAKYLLLIVRLIL